MPAIVKNMLLRDRSANVTYRVVDTVNPARLGVSDIGEYVVLMDTDVTKSVMPHGVSKEVVLGCLGRREWIVVDDDEPSIDLDALSDAEKRVLQKRWQLLQIALSSPFELLHPAGRAQLARKLAREQVATRPTLYEVLRLHWARGPRKQSLLPNYEQCGAPGKPRVPADTLKKTGRPRTVTPGRGVAMTAEHRRKMSVAISSSSAGKKARWLNAAYYHLLITQYHQHVSCQPNSPPQIENFNAVPTFEQFRYFWTRHYDLETRKRKRLGERRFDALTKILASGTLKDLRGPATRYEIDATIVDVYVVSRFNPNHVIGRPTLYLVVDQFSRLIVGYYLGLEPPCWVGAMLALWSCNLDKVELCRQYGIHITSDEWPTGFMPLHLLGDRGEMMSLQAEALSAGFNIDVENTPPYSGAAKGIVERTFGSIQVGSFGPYLPGYVDPEFLGRGEKPPQLDAVVNLDQLTRVLLASIIKHNHHVIREYPGTPGQVLEGVEFTPVALWQWGVKHLRFEGRQFAEEHLARYLWPEKKLALQKRGLHYSRGLWYYGTKLSEQHWFLRALTERREFSARVHPQHLAKVLIVSDDERGTMLPLPVAPRSQPYSRFSLSELTALDHQKKRQNKAAEWRNQPLQAQMSEIIESGVAESKAFAKANRDPLISNNARLKNIRANRQMELDAMSAEAVLGHLGHRTNVVDVTPQKPLEVEQKAFEFVHELLTTTSKN
jgi:hypothetical protein